MEVVKKNDLTLDTFIITLCKKAGKKLTAQILLIRPKKKW